MDNLVTIIVAIIGTGAFNTTLTYIIKAIDRKRDKESGVQKASRLLMKNQLRSLCMHYIEQKWIYEDELEDIIAMHNIYHDDLNGNGFLNEMMERVKDLEIRGIGVK